MSLRASDREQIYSELAKLLGAGFPASQALDTLLDHRLPKAQDTFVRVLKKEIASRQDLAEAVAAGLGIKAGDDLDTSLVQAGQEGGRLPESLTQLSTHYGRERRTTAVVRTRLIYPFLLLHLGIILPALPKAITSGDAAGVWTKVALLIGLLWVIGIIAWFTLRALSKIGGRNCPTDRILRRIPFYGAIRRRGAMSRFADVFGFFLTAGKYVSPALRAAGRASGSALILRDAEHMARRIEKDGSTLSGAIPKRTVLPPSFVRGLSTAESAGSLDNEMANWSTHFAERTEAAAENFGSWVPKIIYFLILGIVAYQIITMMRGVYSGYEEMLDF